MLQELKLARRTLRRTPGFTLAALVCLARRRREDDDLQRRVGHPAAPARDPLTFAAVSAVLDLVALLATLVPARRAASVDPLVAIRHE